MDKKYLKYGGIAIVVLVLLYIVFQNQITELMTNNGDDIGIVSSTSSTSSSIYSVEYFYVEIKGEVERPNTYLVTTKTTINDLVKIAGLTPYSDTSNLNLAEILETGDSITVKKIVVVESSLESSSSSASSASSSSEASGLLNINLATKAELDALPGIGSAKAQKIIDYRTETGIITSYEELVTIIGGISDAYLDEIKSLTTFG